MSNVTEKHRALAIECYVDIATYQDLAPNGRWSDSGCESIIARAIADAEERGRETIVADLFGHGGALMWALRLTAERILALLEVTK